MFLEPCVSALPRRLFVFQFIFLDFTWKGNDDKNCDKRTANFVLVLSSSEKEPRPDGRPDKLLPFCLAATDTHTHTSTVFLSLLVRLYVVVSLYKQDKLIFNSHCFLNTVMTTILTTAPCARTRQFVAREYLCLLMDGYGR